jgi:hypothetical protein
MAGGAAPPRAALADRQAALVAALTGRGEIPPGFDVDRVGAAAAALAAKRARAVAHAWPGLSAMLGKRFRERFDAYAALTALPEAGGPLADGRAFVRVLAAAGPLADRVALQALAVDQQLRLTPRGLVPRRIPRLGWTRLRESGWWVVAFGPHEVRVRLPRLGR